MGFNLETPVLVTESIGKVQITKIINHVDTEFFVIEYTTHKPDDSILSQGNIVIEGYDAVKALYAEQDTLMATGKTFEEASREILYDKVLDTLAG